MKNFWKKKLLFVSAYDSPFVIKDLEILKNHFKVKSLIFTGIKKNPINLLLMFFKILYGIIQTDLSFCWFADIRALYAVFLSKLFNKKSIVVVGGYELANIPELNYGGLLTKFSKMRVKWIFQLADKIFVVDESLKNDTLKNFNININKIKIIPTGYNSDEFCQKGKKENIVLTVAISDTITRIRLKGIHTFVKSADQLRNVSFLIVGITANAKSWLEKDLSGNVLFIDKISQEELISLYRKSKVYCQLSIREGLPNSLCEAMLCECVPVGTKKGGIPTAIGETGYYTEYGNVDETINAIKKALKSDLGKSARNRIMEMFPIEKREKLLLEEIKGLL